MSDKIDKNKSEFIVVKHEAKRANLHYDLRFKMPNSHNWASFAVKKGIPLTGYTKVLANRTHDHSDEDALFLGVIESGYGAGKLSMWDEGKCDILKFTNSHMTIDFKGKKVKGVYHLVSIGMIHSNYKNRGYLLFRGKINVEDK